MEPTQEQPRWEYLILALPLSPRHDTVQAHANILASYGGAGWELVAVVPLGDGGSSPTELRCFFKRRQE